MTGSMPALLSDAVLAFGVLAAFLFLGRASRRWTWYPARLAAFLESRWAPAAAGLVSLVIVRVVWRSLTEPGVVHDERAYLLQAEIFARGHWTAPPPPIAAFFEQMHVFVDPAVFAKYPPVHAMMLVPGIWLGVPGLIPAVLAGVAGALTFWLTRRLTNAWTALLTWMFWTTSPMTLMWATTYFSESTSLVLWLGAACATVLWLESGRPRDLVCVAVALAAGFATRPLTMVALALPLAFVITRKLVQTGRWRDAAVPVLTGIALLGVNPIWNQQTLGDWKVDPYPYYSRTYFPFDKPGFGVDSTPPLRPVPSELLPMETWSKRVHESYAPSTVPSELTMRLRAMLSSYANGWRLVLAALLFGSIVRVRGAARLAVAASAGLFAAYLVFAHPAGWSVYYVELLPGLHFLAAGYLVRLFGHSEGQSTSAGSAPPAYVARAAAAAALLLLPLCLRDLALARSVVDTRNAFHRRADVAIRSAPPNSILFVRYPEDHDPHRAVTRNEANLAAARTWVVYDRGAENADLLALAPDRKPFRLNASTWRVEPMTLPEN